MDVVQAMLIHDKKPTHGVVKSLAVVDWSAARRASAVSARTVVPFVRTTQDDPDAFPGIFSVALPSFCWSPVNSVSVAAANVVLFVMFGRGFVSVCILG